MGTLLILLTKLDKLVPGLLEISLGLLMLSLRVSKLLRILAKIGLSAYESSLHVHALLGQMIVRSLRVVELPATVERQVAVVLASPLVAAISVVRRARS